MNHSPLNTYEDRIEQLPNLDSEYKAWAKEDLKTRAEETESNLMAKYEFYDQMAKIREDILQNVTEKSRPALYGIINNILNEPTHGQGRKIKKESLKRISKICQDYSKNKNLLRFLTERHTDGFERQVYEVLNKEDRSKYEKNYEKVFTSDFWETWNQDPLSHGEFPQLRNAFFYFNPEQFHEKTTLEEVSRISHDFLGAITYEALDLIDNFPSKKQKELQQEFQNFKPKDLTKALQKLLSIKSKENKENQALLVAKMDIKNLLRLKEYKAAEKRIKKIEEIYGHSIEKDILNQLEREKKLKEQHLQALDTDKEQPENKKKRIITNIRQNLLYPTLSSLALASKNVEKLKDIDSYESKKYLQKIEVAQAKILKKSEQEQESTKDNADIGLDKQIKIQFIDKAIEHAQKTKEAAAQLGIPTDDPDFWSQDGCKNRGQWLHNKNKWNDYKKRNSQDKNIPSQKTGSMHYRWLDLRTGSNLTAGKAEQGIKYLQRYKESGYYLAAYGAGFSLNWKPGSPTYDPDRFISLCNEEKGKIMNTKQ